MGDGWGNGWMDECSYLFLVQGRSGMCRRKERKNQNSEIEKEDFGLGIVPSSNRTRKEVKKRKKKKKKKGERT
jgi:hypothetical protein